MRFSVVATDAASARAEAEQRAGSKVHISVVFFVPGRPEVREWVFSTVLSG